MRLIGTLLLMLAGTPALAAGPGIPMIDTDPCPPGWQQTGKTGTNGAFTCRPLSKTSGFLPAEPLACPPGTAYFIEQNAKHARLGCRRLPASPKARPSHFGHPARKGSS